MAITRFERIVIVTAGYEHLVESDEDKTTHWSSDRWLIEHPDEPLEGRWVLREGDATSLVSQADAAAVEALLPTLQRTDESPLPGSDGTWMTLIVRRPHQQFGARWWVAVPASWRGVEALWYRVASINRPDGEVSPPFRLPRYPPKVTMRAEPLSFVPFVGAFFAFGIAGLLLPAMMTVLSLLAISAIVVGFVASGSEDAIVFDAESGTVTIERKRLDITLAPLRYPLTAIRSYDLAPNRRFTLCLDDGRCHTLKRAVGDEGALKAVMAWPDAPTYNVIEHT